ncbi:MAG: type II toxin-antitoxin system RelE/ParE family toxin [Chloracidobacterium sp.]|nr:type II toxin-antitoxin system RelE/ParE family toxin [Chloracidobacterium sp.]
MKKLTIAPSALSDLDEIWNYLAEQSETAAEDVIRALTNKFDLLTSNPVIGVARDDLMIDMRMFPHKRYNIFYFLNEEELEIYRVLHASRDIDSIFDLIA